MRVKNPEPFYYPNHHCHGYAREFFVSALFSCFGSSARQLVLAPQAVPCAIMDSFPARLHALASNAKSRDEVFTTVWSFAEGIEQQLSFYDFACAAVCGAQNFESLGIKPGERVGLLSKGTLDFFVALVSLQCFGATPVLLNWRQPADNLRGMLDDSDARSLAVGAPFHALGLETARSLFLSLDDRVPDALQDRYPRWRWDLKQRRLHALGSMAASINARCEAAVFFTSGSTSRPKPVLHTHATLLWTADNFVVTETKDDSTTRRTTLCFMPNFHVLMSFQNFLLPMARGFGASLHGADATESVTSTMLLAAAGALQPMTIDTVPFIMAEWSQLSAAQLEPLQRCAAVRSGGAALPNAVAQRLVDAGITVQTHYGQTEAPGMQLLSVRGARADELCIMSPPWSCVAVDLACDDEDTAEQGELVIHGCGGSSPGYLEAGTLRPGRLDSGGWHRTGDVFKWTTTRSGKRGLQHVMRVDDVVVLSTGEQFNPLPFEQRVQEYALKTPTAPALAGVVVLGKGRPAPIFVVELARSSAARVLTAMQAIELLQPGIDEANAAEVEYARVRPGHVLVLESCENLPKSAKGNVRRGAAERELHQRLNELEEAALLAVADAVDWDTLRDKAKGAGYGEDVDRYLAEKGTADLAVMGIDSLGVATLSNSRLREAERVGDNVKAWVITCVVMTHWYSPKIMSYGSGNGALDIFYAAQVGGGYTAVAWLVQYFVTASCFILGFFQQSPTASMLALFFSLGWTDGIRDAPTRRVQESNTGPRLGRREVIMVILVVFYKVVVYPASLAAFFTAPKPDRLRQPAPLLVVWYLYALLWYRVGTILSHRCKIPLPLVAAGALVLVGLINEGGENQFTCPFCSIPIRAIPLLNAVLSFLFNTNAVLVFPNSIPEGTLDAWEFYPSSSWHIALGVYNSPPLTSNVRWFEAKILIFFAPYLLAYAYGDLVVAWCRRNLRSATACVAAAYGLNLYLTSVEIAWVGRNRSVSWWPSDVRHALPPPRTSSANVLWVSAVPSWVWQPSPSTFGNGIATWDPIWARPAYMAFDWTASTAIAIFIVGACVAVPWRANRCGNAALGKFILMQAQPTASYAWLCWLVSKLGDCLGAHSPWTGFIQLMLLIAWPYAFVYFIGPILTSVVVFVPRLVFGLYHLPTLSRDDILQLPADASAWWTRYCGEVRRDSAALLAWLNAAAASIISLFLKEETGEEEFDKHAAEHAPLLDARKRSITYTDLTSDSPRDVTKSATFTSALIGPVTSTVAAILLPTMSRSLRMSAVEAVSSLCVVWLGDAAGRLFYSLRGGSRKRSKTALPVAIIAYVTSVSMTFGASSSGPIFMARCLHGFASSLIDPAPTTKTFSSATFVIVAPALLTTVAEMFGSWRAAYALLAISGVACFLTRHHKTITCTQETSLLRGNNFMSRLYFGFVGVCSLVSATTGATLVLLPFVLSAQSITPPAVLGILVCLSGVSFLLLSHDVADATSLSSCSDTESFAAVRSLMTGPYLGIIIALICSSAWFARIPSSYIIEVPIVDFAVVGACFGMSAVHYFLLVHARAIYISSLTRSTRDAGRCLARILELAAAAVAGLLTALFVNSTLTTASPRTLFQALTALSSIIYCWFWIVLGIAPPLTENKDQVDTTSSDSYSEAWQQQP